MKFEVYPGSVLTNNFSTVKFKSRIKHAAKHHSKEGILTGFVKRTFIGFLQEILLINGYSTTKKSGNSRRLRNSNPCRVTDIVLMIQLSVLVKGGEYFDST